MSELRLLLGYIADKKCGLPLCLGTGLPAIRLKPGQWDIIRGEVF